MKEIKLEVKMPMSLLVLVLVLALVLPIVQVSAGEETTSAYGCAQRKSIFFLALGEDGAATNNTICSIRSACYLNPSLGVYVYGESPEMERALKWVRERGCPSNLFYVPLDETSILAHTPLEMLHNNTRRNLTTGPYHLNNRANALRLALLYKRGGAYLDTDMVSLRPLSHLPCEALGAQSTVFSAARNMTVATKMNTAAMVFNAKSPYLLKCMKSFVADFQPYTWAYQGPHLVSRLYFRNYESAEGVRDVLVLRKEVFYPVGVDTNKQVKPFFVSPASHDFKQAGFDDPTVSVHLWNKHSTSWLKLGAIGRRGGWVMHPESQAALVLHACMADTPLPPPLFRKTVSGIDAKELFLCPPGVYCGK